MRDLRDLPGIKEKELAALGPCLVCGKHLLEEGILFYRVSVEFCGFDAQAVKQRVGLEMMLGSGPLARAMGPDADMANVMTGPVSAVIHQGCADAITPKFLFQMLERADDGEASCQQ